MGIDRNAAVRDACERAIAALRAGDVPAALGLYEYAQRLAPGDGEVALAIATVLLSQREPRAIDSFVAVAERHDVQEAWQGLVSACHSLSRHDEAAANLRVLLSRHGYLRGAVHADLQDAIAMASGAPGWCALSAKGRLHVALVDAAAEINRVVVLLDRSPIGLRPRRCVRENGRLRAIYRLPNVWRQVRQIEVCLAGQHLLGSPLLSSVIGHVEGFVRAEHGGIVGWVWYPRDPDCAPSLSLRDANGGMKRFIASDPAFEVRHPKPFARPRKIAILASDIAAFTGPLAVLDEAGRDLFGSPLDPQVDQRSAAGAAELARRMFPATASSAVGEVDLSFLAVPADIVGVHAGPRKFSRAPGVDVIVPVYRGHEQTMTCITSVLTTLPDGVRCVVIDDASPEPELIEALRDLAVRGRIVLCQQPKNRGFPAAANAGICATADRDVILLNSDTLVAPGWIERLAEAAYSASDIGSATPLSNDATVFSYPRSDEPNAAPDQAETIRLDHLARRANGAKTVDVPTAHGFCVYLRRDCLASVGLLREDLFAQGYGEENDFCIRARHLGWRHVAVPGVFVGHAGAGSFGSAKAQLLERNLAIVNRLHPGYDALIESFRQADPLAQGRFAIDALRWKNRRSRKGAVILVTHARAGGVSRHVEERSRAIATSGLRPIVLTPFSDARGRSLCVMSDGSNEAFPNLRFEIMDDVADLAAFLRDDKPIRVEFHHFIGHGQRIFCLPSALRVPYDVMIHDYAWVCPRITFVGADKRYCGEPGGGTCEACHTDIGGMIDEDIPPTRLRLRSGDVMRGARRVVVPSADVARRLANYYSGVDFIVTPWEDDGALPPRTDQFVRRLRLRVAIVGAIGVEKGYEYLLACARHVAARRLALEFAVVGHTCDDRRLLETGVVTVTGRYAENEAVELIRAQQAELAFLPALWPETWSYTLSQMWLAGLEVVAFDIGAPAERIRRTGRGSLLPLGLPPAAACLALLAYRSHGDTSRVQPVERQPPIAAA